MQDIDSKILNKLIAVKVLLNDALKSVNESGVQRAFAILHTHNALDWMFQIAYSGTVGAKKNEKMYIEYYAREVNKSIPKLIDIGNLSRVNTLRKNFKHDFIFPDPELTKELISWAENQINTICQRIFHISLAEIDLVIAIASPEIKEQITKADDVFSGGKVPEAFCELAIAFAMVKYDLQERIEKLTDRNAIFETDFTFSNSFFLHIRDMGNLVGEGYKIAETWDQIIKSTEYLINMSFINFLGIGMYEFFQFQAITPKPLRTMNGKYHCSINERLAVKMRASEYSKCRNFVIEGALKAQSKVL